MHPFLFYEAFFYCSRDDLERLQPLSQSLLDVIVNGSKKLPLRPIFRVDMNSGDESKDKIQIFVEEEDARAELPNYEASDYDGDFAKTFRRLQHTCVMNFNVGIHNSPFLRYWKTQEAAFTVLDIFYGTPETRNYDILDSIVNHVRPRATEVDVHESSWHGNDYNSQLMQLLARGSLLASLQICRLDVSEGAFPPTAFFLNEPGYPKYELYCESNVAEGIDALIESFLRDGCANKKFESVCIYWCHSEAAPKQLGKLTKTDAPLPEVGLMHFSPFSAEHRVAKCETQSFVNKKQWKRMEVIKWIVEDKGFVQLYETHFLLCRVMDL